MDKYLFLDVDGVLNSDDFYDEFYKWKTGHRPSEKIYPEGTAMGGYERNIDRTCVDVVNQICKDTGAKIILSSCWRTDERCIDEFRKLGLEIFGRTPYLEDRHRGTEIKRFLETHPFESYCILDDDTDILEEQENNFVHVDFHFGVTCKDADKAVEILGKVL